MPLYKLLKKTDAFIWTEEAQQALVSLKATLTLAPILVAPEWGEPLLVYVATSIHVVSAALVIEREELGHHLKVQRPVYFVREVLTDPMVRYPQVQKLLYAVLMMTQKLLHYFTDHEVMVVTSYPLRDIITAYRSFNLLIRSQTSPNPQNLHRGEASGPPGSIFRMTQASVGL